MSIPKVVFNAVPDLCFDLSETGCVEDLLFSELSSRPHFSEALHGYPHWLSVFDNARWLIASFPEGSLSAIQTTMTLLAAFLNDVGRCIPRSISANTAWP